MGCNERPTMIPIEFQYFQPTSNKDNLLLTMWITSKNPGVTTVTHTIVESMMSHLE